MWTTDLAPFKCHVYKVKNRKLTTPETSTWLRKQYNLNYFPVWSGSVGYWQLLYRCTTLFRIVHLVPYHRNLRKFQQRPSLGPLELYLLTSSTMQKNITRLHKSFNITTWAKIKATSLHVDTNMLSFTLQTKQKVILHKWVWDLFCKRNRFRWTWIHLKICRYICTKSTDVSVTNPSSS